MNFTTALASTEHRHEYIDVADCLGWLGLVRDGIAQYGTMRIARAVWDWCAMESRNTGQSG